MCVRVDGSGDRLRCCNRTAFGRVRLLGVVSWLGFYSRRLWHVHVQIQLSVINYAAPEPGAAPGPPPGEVELTDLNLIRHKDDVIVARCVSRATPARVLLQDLASDNLGTDIVKGSLFPDASGASGAAAGTVGVGAGVGAGAAAGAGAGGWPTAVTARPKPVPRTIEVLGLIDVEVRCFITTAVYE